MQIITIIYSLFCIFIISYPYNYISELAISFLPYHVAVLLILLLINIYQTRRTVVFDTKQTKKRFMVLTTLLCGIVFMLYTNKFKSFYEIINITSKQTNTVGPKILYANIHKYNENYDEIKKTIENTNPDLVMFVEFSESHYDHLKDFLKTNYPYVNSTSRSKKFIGSMVFSKTPIINRADDFPQGAWKYGYFQINYKQKDYYIYLVHTSSPDDYLHFSMRNDQLQILGKDISKHQNHRSNGNIIILGDFNVSPRSIYYQDFEKEYLSGMINQTKKIPFLFTRTFKDLPFVKSHIDQIRTTINIDSEIQIINIKGSDHKGFILQLNS